MKRLKQLMWAVAVGLVAAAMYQELRKPPEERTWHGRIFGVIPYDFRFPTLESIREAYWNPGNPRVFTDRVLGIGWAVNLYQLWRWLGALSPRMASW